jgi:hypothetical protein
MCVKVLVLRGFTPAHGCGGKVFLSHQIIRGRLLSGIVAWDFKLTIIAAQGCLALDAG